MSTSHLCVPNVVVVVFFVLFQCMFEMFDS